VLGSAAMFWPAIVIGDFKLPTWTLDVVGLALFGLVVLMQIVFKPENLRPLPMEAD